MIAEDIRLQGYTYQCAQCNGIFSHDTANWSEEDINAGANKSTCIICHECYKTLRLLKPTNFFEWIASMVAKEEASA